MVGWLAVAIVANTPGYIPDPGLDYSVSSLRVRLVCLLSRGRFFDTRPRLVPVKNDDAPLRHIEPWFLLPRKGQAIHGRPLCALRWKILASECPRARAKQLHPYPPRRR